MGRGLWSLVELSLDGAANIFGLDYDVTRSCLWTVRVAAAVPRRRPMSPRWSCLRAGRDATHKVSFCRLYTLYINVTKQWYFLIDFVHCIWRRA